MKMKVYHLFGTTSLLKLIGTVLLVSIIIAGCSSMKSDAKKLAELACKAQKLEDERQKKILAGDMSANNAYLEESIELANEMMKLVNKVKQKYPTPAEQRQLEIEFAKAFLDCNPNSPIPSSIFGASSEWPEIQDNSPEIQEQIRIADSITNAHAKRRIYDSIAHQDSVEKGLIKIKRRK